MMLMDNHIINVFGGYEIHPYPSPTSESCLSDHSATVLNQTQASIISSLQKSFPIQDANSFFNLVHFQTGYNTPVQRWFPYREGYSVNLVNAFINELQITGNVFDPFCGSGTTLLSARLNNLNSFGIDVNPISALVSKVENTRYSKQDVGEFINELNNIKQIEKSSDLFTTSFNLADKLFNKEILQSILQIKSFVNSISNLNIRNLFFVIWLSIIESCSNFKKEGNGIKYKNRKRTPTGYINIDKDLWESQVFPDDKFSFVKEKIVASLELVLDDLKYHYGQVLHVPLVFNGNCLEFDKLFSDEVQFTFYSPPYCNCFDYFEIHKAELWLGDFVSSREELNALRNMGFRSNTNTLNHKPVKYKNQYLESLLSLFDISNLWSSRIPEVIRGYFDDSYTLFTKLYNQTTKGGYVGVVIGNSAYSNVIIPSDLLLADIASNIGFNVKSIFVVRHLTTSSQQKKALASVSDYLRESILLLVK